MVADGLWHLVGYRPLTVIARDRFARLLEDHGMAVPHQVADGQIAVSTWRRLYRAMAADVRVQLERLLVGGDLLFADVIHNLVVNAGLDYALDAALSGGTAITSWFVGLTDGTPTVAAGDTTASHAGWVEVTAYSEATRQAWTDGGVSGQSVSNSASKATFTINANSTTIGGGFLVSVSTKGAATGTLYAAGAFTNGDKTLNTNDTVDVTATFTVADDGL